MKIGVIRFPGTNCDRDVAKAIELAGATPEYVWWNEDITGKPYLLWITSQLSSCQGFDPYEQDHAGKHGIT